MIIEESKLLKKKLKNILEKENFGDNFNAIDVNGDKPFTFTKQDFSVKEGKPIYTDSNKFGKSGSATAVISKNTIAIYSSEDIIYPEPINWEKLKHQREKLRNGKERTIFQKCHIIGYHLSARFSNPHNIFIGTDDLNHGSMQEIENNICDEVINNGRTFLYKVTPLYNFKNDIIPIGVLFEYETIDEKEKITHCKFCFNIEKGYTINYYDGSSMRFEEVDKRENEIIKKVENKSIASKETNIYKNYYVDVRNKVFHLVFDEKEKCEGLKNVKIKYIQEVTGKPEEIIAKKFKICEKCNKNTRRVEKCREN